MRWTWDDTEREWQHPTGCYVTEIEHFSGGRRELRWVAYRDECRPLRAAGQMVFFDSAEAAMQAVEPSSTTLH